MKYAGEFRWEVELNVECPHCNVLFDANHVAGFYESQLEGVHVWDKAANRRVACPKCSKIFKFDIGGGR